MIEFQELDRYRENNRIEVKKASKGLPKSIWETYSSFANTLGGIILLGITEQNDGSFRITGVENRQALLKDFWNGVNNAQKVSLNILKDENITEFEKDGLGGIAIVVPRADRAQKPIYINNNILGGTYRRNHDGDYHCTEIEVKNMLRDQADLSQDMLVLEEMDLDVLDFESLKRYRNRMAHQKPGHVWEELDDKSFLYRIGGAAKGKDRKTLYPTLAGLLMFGYEYEIVKALPDYFLDYQEKMDDTTRWTDRIVSTSGEWSGNLFDFYFKVYNKIVQDVKIPFKIENGTDRVDDTPVHKALREALANALIHACYYDRMGIVIRKLPNKIVIENPGILRISKESALLGGHSDPRNATIIKMFNLINIGERSGSGIPNIFNVWKNENYCNPELMELFNPDRTILVLPLEKSGAKIGSKTDRHLQQIINFLSQNGESSRADIEDFLLLKSSRTGQLLSILIERDIVARNGNSKSYKYKLKE